ncbi:hypothetical protein C7C46_23175 [Streptomyces tateyamensis]|uniref:Integral membrane protein n=1 Tax=Streptomyces tateyamensis TaxID=565073 RepID=A0A2V4MXQ5_9ACTN|nr:hypothetical protein C7C46_23175 [Streptomyces tateyamensis]
MAGWDLRLLRAVPFALLCTLIAAVGHGLAGGGVIAPPTLALGFALVCAVAVLLGGRERTLPGIAAALGLGQLGLHLLFHGGGHQDMAGMPGMTGRAGLTLDQVASRLVCNDTPGLPHVLPPGMSAERVVGAAGLDPHAFQHAAAATAPWWSFGLTPAMLAGHLLAALVAGWWLRRGEAAVWRLVRLSGRAAARELRTLAAPLHRALALVAAVLRGLLAPAEQAGPVRRRERGERWLPTALILRHSVVRRGPPVWACAH